MIVQEDYNNILRCTFVIVVTVVVTVIVTVVVTVVVTE